MTLVVIVGMFEMTRIELIKAGFDALMLGKATTELLDELRD